MLGADDVLPTATILYLPQTKWRPYSVISSFAIYVCRALSTLSLIVSSNPTVSVLRSTIVTVV